MPENTTALSAMVWRFGVALSSAMPSLLPNQSLVWIEENTRQIRKALDNAPVFPNSDMIDLGKAIYPRLTAYTYGRLKLQAGAESECTALKESHSEWVSLDDITQIASHETIHRTLREHLVKCSKITRSDRKHLFEMHHLDILYLLARIVVIISNPERCKQFVKQTNATAQSLLNLLQALLDSEYGNDARASLLRTTFQIAKNSGLFPTNLILDGVKKKSDNALDGGSFSDVWEGVLSQQPVAIKVMRRLSGDDDIKKIITMFTREAVLCRQFHHPNVLPFYGIHLWRQETRPPVICLVSPWMYQGNITEYLKNNPNADRLSLILDVAKGLKYLHEFDPHVIHGDLKGTNILVDASDRACLADFGLCTLEQDPVIQFTPTSSNLKYGTFGYLAPELIRPPPQEVGYQSGHKTSASDVYAFGVVVYEIFTSHIRYHRYNLVDTLMATLTNAPTEKPDSIDDALWKLVEECWETNPAKRPTIGAIVNILSTGKSLERESNPIARLQSPTLDAEAILPKDAATLSAVPTPLVSEGEHIDIKRGDIVIAVMGPSGTGKSSFINQAMGCTVTAALGGFESCTKEVRAFGCKHPDGSNRSIILVDTPGFDDSTKTDYEVLEDIALWLEQTYRKKITLSGIFQFHSIQDTRMRGTALRNLEMFRILCGPDALKNVILLTTFWDQVHSSVGSRRESQFRSLFWKEMTERGSRVARFDPPTYECAWDLIDLFQTPARITEPKPALAIQIELVEKNKQLWETSVFDYLLRFWTRIVESMRGKGHTKSPSDSVKRASKQKENLEKCIPGSARSSITGDGKRGRLFWWDRATRKDAGRSPS